MNPRELLALAASFSFACGATAQTGCTTQVASLRLSDDIRAIEIAGDVLFATAESAGLYAIDISTPSAPVVLSQAAGSNATLLEVSDDRAAMSSE